MAEEIYADVKNEDPDELRPKNDDNINNLYQEKSRFVFSYSGMSISKLIISYSSHKNGPTKHIHIGC